MPLNVTKRAGRWIAPKDTTKCIVPWEWINFPYIKFLDSDLVAYGTFTTAEDNDLIEELESR